MGILDESGVGEAGVDYAAVAHRAVTKVTPGWQAVAPRILAHVGA
jgi:hypothetical protein